MAGTLFGLGLAPQFDANGDLARGALLYVYEANTSTPAVTYSDFALGSAQAWPLPADGAGRLPAFYVTDGSYRARLTTSAGVVIFDEQAITAIGASSSGSGDSASQDTTTLIQTGDTIWVLTTGARSGFVRCNGRTIGSGSSGGTERANADTQSLFETLWNNISDSFCTVSSGRGASASADFSANKTITTPDMRGRAPFGLDDMGNSAASRLAGGTPTTLASNGGAETYTISANNLPTHTHAAGTYAVSTTITNGTTVVRTSNFVNNVVSSGGASSDVPEGANDATLSLASGTVTGTSGNNTTTATALTTTPPYKLGTWYIKL
jgi:microcystin-dependent protein